jgi:hypothetical protein
MSRRVNTKSRRSKKQLRKQIRTLTALFALLSNENMVRMSPQSMLLQWAWAASPGCPHLQSTGREIPTPIHQEPATSQRKKLFRG